MSKQKLTFLNPIFIVVGLVVLWFIGQWVVQTFQKPGHMGVIESQAMDMTVKPPEGTMPVEVETVQESSFDSAVTYTGTAVAYNDIPIYPRTEGWIASLSVYPGDKVKAGQVLAQLDTRELTARLQGFQYRQTKANEAIHSTKANLDYWRNKIDRSKALVKEEVITQEEFEGERSQYEAAKSEYAQALSELNATRADTQAQSIVKGYTTIMAPIDGVITERSVPKGTLASPGMQILRMTQLNPIRIQAYVVQSDIGRIKVGAPVRIWKTKDKTVKPMKASVSAVFPVADIKSRTAIVEAVIPNKDQQFVPGDYARMMILTGQKENVLTVANTALVTVDQQKAVWVMREGKAQLRYVTTGDTNGDRMEIVQGLKPGEQIIVRGNEDLQSGMAVVAAEYGPEGLKALPKVISSTRLDASNGYKVNYPMEHLTLTIELSPKPPISGDNNYTLTIASMHGVPPSDLVIEMTAVMPSMASMPVPKPSVEKAGAGLFKGKVNLMMPGLWEVKVVVKQRGKILVSPTFEVEVPES